MVTHEIGHNFSSPHTHCYSGIGGDNNPVDACWSQDSRCWSGTTSLPGVNSLTGGTSGQNNGTIMSYCHQLSGGYSNIALTFRKTTFMALQPMDHSKIADYVANMVANNPSCIGVSTDGGTNITIDYFSVLNTSSLEFFEDSFLSAVVSVTNHDSSGFSSYGTVYLSEDSVIRTEITDPTSQTSLWVPPGQTDGKNFSVHIPKLNLQSPKQYWLGVCIPKILLVWWD